MMLSASIRTLGLVSSVKEPSQNFKTFSEIREEPSPCVCIICDNNYSLVTWSVL